MLMACGSASSPNSTVEPVVESPDMLSKNARVNDSPGRQQQYGTVAPARQRTQVSVTSR